MHYSCEIVIPRTSEIEKAVASIMAPFDENGSDEDHSTKHSFWDYWKIGGRWSGRKLKASIGQERLTAFEEWCQSANITVSGVQFGKPTLHPASQIEKVDAKWREMFPGTTDHCPLFDHAPNCDDVQALAVVSPLLSASRVIIAAPEFHDGKWTGPLRAVYMVEDEHWNGVTWIESKWDGKLVSALEAWNAKLGNYKEEYREAVTPQPDWLAVTVDYHS